MEKPGSPPEILKLPFFTLEYEDGFFRRAIPDDARNLSPGLFEWKGKIFRLPPDANEALAQTEIAGKALLSLLNRGPNPLVRAGPRRASPGDRLTELRLCARGHENVQSGDSLVIELCFPLGDDTTEWLPLTGLPHHRLYRGVIYEIIDSRTIDGLTETWGETRVRVTESPPRKGARFILKWRDIPHFADKYGLAIYQFGDENLKTLLAPDSVFANSGELSLVLAAAGEENASLCADAFLVWKESRYPAREISARMTGEYISLESDAQGARWVRRSDLTAAGIFPLGSFAGGMAMEKTKGKPADFSRRSGLRIADTRFDGQSHDIKIIPPETPDGGNAFTFQPEEKFAQLPGPSLYSELALIDTDGQAAPFVPLRLLKGSLNIDRMDEQEKAFYLYWRAEFRRGNIIKTDETYIRVYARELCVFARNAAETEKNFLLLVKLWQSYRAAHSALGIFLPRWILDYQAVYEIAGFAMPLVPLLASGCDDALLCDINLHRNFIGENNSIAFHHIKHLIPRLSRANETGAFLFSQTPEVPALLIRDFETAINAIDVMLREEFRMSLFEFFYPPARLTERRGAFTGMENAGHSAYSVTGVRFSKHQPLIEFIDKLFCYLEHFFAAQNAPDSPGAKKCSPLNEPWKRVTDAALGLGTGALPASRVTLSKDRLHRLRGDSDAVRELLTVEETDAKQKDAPRHEESPALYPRAGEASAKKEEKESIEKILATLAPPEIEALIIISDSRARAELELVAKKNNTMAELLIDRINAAFLEKTGDLLIDTVDEMPVVQSEYRKELDEALKDWGKRKKA